MPKISPPLHEYARLLGGEVRGGQILCPGPGHTAADRSLAVKMSDGDDIVVHSFADDDVILCKDYVRTKLGLPPFKKSNGKDQPRKVIVAEYDYTDESGELLFQVVRLEPKSFRQRRPNGNGGWDWKLGDVRRVPFRLPELIEAIAAEHPVFIVEGEKDVLALSKLGIIATTNAGGAGKWRSEFSQYLRGADVILLPDNDEPGWKHVHEVGTALAGIAARTRILLLPSLPPKGDICNWLDAGGTREQFDALVERAQDWQPPKADDDQEKAKSKATAQENELLEALAKLRPGVEFDRQRRQAADALGVRREAIDNELEARRSSEKQAAPMYGHWIVDPWPEVADGDSLLCDIVKRIQRHVICSHDCALASALWDMSAWVHDEVATHSPILNINSVEPECGKTTLLGLLSFLMPRCVPSVEISEAALFRAIELWQPSFVIDEFDAVLASEDKGGLRSVINSGHARGQGVVRCVEPDFTPRVFKTFCPKAIGMIGRKLPAATLSRCIIIELRRRKASELIAEKFDHNDNPELAQLRQRLLRWSIGNAETLRGAKPSMPEAFDNRRADNWRLMLAIADLAGGDWGEKARQAAARLEGAADTTTIGARLLTDIKRIREETKDDCILSATLVEKLKADEEAPWVGWANGKGLTQNSLATLLSGGGGRGRASRGGFGIRSETVHPESEDRHGRGYKWTQFEDAWARYLPAEIPPSPPSSPE